MIPRAKTTEDYIDWIQQAIFEIQDLRDCLEYYLDEQGHYPAFLEPLDKQINALFESMKNGTYRWGTEDLEFLALARKHADEIPFVDLLARINETHRHGLDVEDV
jgi:hypothetical protein